MVLLVVKIAHNLNITEGLNRPCPAASYSSRTHLTYEIMSNRSRFVMLRASYLLMIFRSFDVVTDGFPCGSPDKSTDLVTVSECGTRIDDYLFMVIFLGVRMGSGR